MAVPTKQYPRVGLDGPAEFMAKSAPLASQGAPRTSRSTSVRLSMLPLRILLATSLIFTTSLLPAQNGEGVPAAVQESVDRAVRYLLDHQNPEHAFFGLDNDRRANPKQGDGRLRPPQYSSALTGLSLMGLSSVGHLPSGQGREAEAAARALDYLLRDEVIDDRGYYGRTDNSQMYGHGIATLALAEMLGMGRDEKQDQKCRERLEKAVEVIIRSQKVEKPGHLKGGWRYDPESRDSDISASVWQVMALRGARNAGLEIPNDSIRNAVNYISRSYASARDGNGQPKDKEAGFYYQVTSGNKSFSTTAAGVLALQVCGQYDAPEVLGGGNYLIKNPPKRGSSWFFYGLYYYSQGMNQLDGDFREISRKHVRDILLESQDGDGSWRPHNGSEGRLGKAYGTSMALLSLSVQHQYLPIYQR